MSSQTPLKPSFEVFVYTDMPKAVRRSHNACNESYNFFGHYDPAALRDLLTEFCMKHEVEGDIRGALKDFLDHIESVHLLPEQTSVWTCLRLQRESNRWQIPRPHHDGRYWDRIVNSPDGALPFKVGTVLAGPGTLFWDTPHCTEETARAAHLLTTTGVCERAKETGTTPSNVDVREWAHAELNKLGVGIVKLRLGQAVRWIVGSPSHAAIHSEPDMSNMPDGRIFVSLLPGSEEQIRSQARKWNANFVAGKLIR